ncbi:MAG: hypothetical protein GY815_17565 [Gammaproteobacteria bacterium]|nr:hypothetical protein [Gammaproteobacteria bacterium]
MQELLYETILVAIFLFYPAWRIFDRTGLNRSYSFTLLIPFIGLFVCAGILAYSTWHIKSIEEKHS